jgi:putative SOS response-associated peptidase YedK
MCGRFTLRTPSQVLVEQFQLASVPELKPRYNIAPTQPVPVVRQATPHGAQQLCLLRWGLVPSWAEDATIGSRLINARAETVATKPSFRSAFRKRRCLVVADGYYEWQKCGATKQPFFIHRPDDRPLAFAGLWDSWTGGEPGDPPLESCTIITTAADDFTRAIHDRMPVILAPDDYSVWLDTAVTDIEPLQALLERPLSGELAADPITTHVNNPRNDDPRCLEPRRIDEP